MEEREYYQDIATRAMCAAREKSTSSLWRSAFDDLARAADRIDAMIARTQISSSVSPDEPEEPADWWKDEVGQ